MRKQLCEDDKRRVDEIRKRCEQADPGPRRRIHDRIAAARGPVIRAEARGSHGAGLSPRVNLWITSSEEQMIQNAREDMLFLCDLIDSLESSGATDPDDQTGP